jgi:cell division protein FtsN
MAENRREKDRRYYFTRGQLALLGAAFTAAGAVIFVLGMFVGKEIEARKLVRPEEPLVTVPIRPQPRSGAEAENAKSKDDLTFYNTLTKTPASPTAEAKAEEQTAENSPKSTSGRSKAKAEDDADAKGTRKQWSIQINSFPDARSAEELIDRLKNKGYNAYVTEANVQGKTWYRVRVGRFASREEALKTETALKNNEGYAKAFATRK